MTYRNSADAFLSHPTDHELVLQAQKGQLAAMHTLFERHHLIIYRYLVHMLAHPTIAQELTTEVFLKAWDAIFTFETTDDFTNWLYRIATNLTHLYQKRYHTHYQKHLQALPTSEEHKHAALSQVPFLDRACLILHDHEGLSYEHIACVFKMTPRKIQRLRARGLAQLIQLLPPEQHATLDTLTNHLNQLAIPETHIASPFTRNPEQPRLYVPYLTAGDSYTRAPRIPISTQCILISQRIWRQSAPAPHQQHLPPWSVLGLISCILVLLITSSALEKRQDITIQHACIFQNPANNILTYNYDKKATICTHQTRQIQGYTFTLQQVHLNNNQILLRYLLEDSTHTQLLYWISSMDLNIQVLNAFPHSSASTQYTCSLSSYIDNPTKQPFTFTSSASFYDLYPDITSQKSSTIVLTIAVREIVISKTYESNSYTTLQLSNNAILQFHLTLPPSSLPLYPTPLKVRPYDYTCA